MGLLKHTCLAFLFAIWPSVSMSQEVLGELEINEYLRCSKLKCDSYLLVVKVEFSCEPGHPSSCTGSDRFVELQSKADDLKWRRAERDARVYETPPDGMYPCQSFPKRWSTLTVGNQVFGVPVDPARGKKDLFQFSAVKSIDPECLVFPELYDTPFWIPARREKASTTSTVSRFVSNLHCIEAIRKPNSDVVVSKWSYDNGSMTMWEVESEDGYPLVVKWLVYSKPIGRSVPDIKPIEYETYNRIEWQEDEYGKYPKKVVCMQNPADTNSGVISVVEAEFKLHVEDEPYREELGKIKKRLEELKTPKSQ